MTIKLLLCSMDCSPNMYKAPIVRTSHTNVNTLNIEKWCCNHT